MRLLINEQFFLFFWTSTTRYIYLLELVVRASFVRRKTEVGIKVGVCLGHRLTPWHSSNHCYLWQNWQMQGRMKAGKTPNLVLFLNKIRTLRKKATTSF